MYNHSPSFDRCLGDRGGPERGPEYYLSTYNVMDSEVTKVFEKNKKTKTKNKNSNQ